MGSAEDELIQLKNKYELSQKNLRYLTVLGFRAAEDYDKLFKMYDDNQKQYESLKMRLQDTEAKLTKLQQALMPACEEYNQLNRHLQIETACRIEIESIASEVTRENRKLKHQSQLLLDKLGESKCDLKFLETITDESEPCDSKTAACSLTELNTLNDKIASLEEDVRVLQQRLRSSESEKEAAKKSENDLKIKIKKLEGELFKTCKQIDDYEGMISNFKRTSMLALGEFSQMKDSLEKELLLKQKAEEYAHQMLVQRDTIVRQSSILLNSAMSDGRVMHAMNEIDKLTQELETVKKENQAKVKDLEEQISSSGDVQKVQSLETELDIASSEVNRLHRAVQELEDWKHSTLDEMKDLRSRLEEAEDRLRPPPPPPPPPPPACPPPFLGPKLYTVKANSSQSSSGETSPGSGEASLASRQSSAKSKESQLANAMSEMMARIKAGNVLAKGSGATVKVAKKQEPPKAMLELENILKSLNTKRSEESVEDAVVKRRPSQQATPPPVFPKISRRKPSDTSAAASAMESSELQRKMSQMQDRKARQTDAERKSESKNDSPTSPKAEEASCL